MTDATQYPLWVLDLTYREWETYRQDNGQPGLRLGAPMTDDLGVLAPTLKAAKAAADLMYVRFGDKRMQRVDLVDIIEPGDTGHPYPRKARKEGAQ